MEEAETGVACEVVDQRMLGQEESAALVEAYRGGALVLELARRFGVHRHTDRHAQRAGVVKRPVVRMSRRVLAEARELYAHGLSVAGVGKKLGLSASTVYSTFAREGVRMRCSTRADPKPHGLAI
ncbi:hypothetical protein [Actinokineospora sp. NBRC 105648]|uniref:hypothetical protein n=1 Tax=Actinokineospora sp. NBRC 105648 TaxID=3032206 RepID=UPI002554F860|nr:hypothetical protein [Actinokineospora sp. NBRC 105648]